MAKTTKKTETKTAPIKAKKPKTKMPKTLEKVKEEDVDMLSVKDAEQALAEGIIPETEVYETDMGIVSEDNNAETEEEAVRAAMGFTDMTGTPFIVNTENIDVARKKFAEKEKTANDAVNAETKSDPAKEEEKKENPKQTVSTVNGINLTSNIGGEMKVKQNTMRQMMGYDHMGVIYDD